MRETEARFKKTWNYTEDKKKSKTSYSILSKHQVPKGKFGFRLWKKKTCRSFGAWERKGEER